MCAALLLLLLALKLTLLWLACVERGRHSCYSLRVPPPQTLHACRASGSQVKTEEVNPPLP